MPLTHVTGRLSSVFNLRVAALLGGIALGAANCGSRTPEPEETVEVAGRQGVPLSQAYAYADPDAAHYAEAKKLQGACHAAYQALLKCDGEPHPESDTDDPAIDCTDVIRNAYTASDDVVTFLRSHPTFSDTAHLVIIDAAGWPKSLNGCTGRSFIYGPSPL